MTTIKSFKNYLKKKKAFKKLGTTSIPNLDQINSASKTIVFISNSIPKHDQDSGANRLKEIITSYRELGYNCILCVENVFEIDNYVTFYNDLGVVVFIETRLYKNYLDFLTSLNKIDFIWYNGAKNLQNYFTTLSKSFPQSKSIFDMVDIHFLRYQRAIALEPFRISFRKKYYKYYKIETELAQKVDLVVTISEVEKEIMSQYLTNSRIITISNVHYNKVDETKITPFGEREDLLFIGSSHEPNVDAIHYLFEEIMPRVWQHSPDVRVNIIGNVKDKIHSISHPNITLLGFIEDVAPYFLSSKLMVAPLRYGAGVKGKIGQAFEYYLPVVTTALGAEGMFLENKKHAYISDTADEFSKQILSLYNDKEMWSKYSHNSTKSLDSFSKERLKVAIQTI